VIVVFFCVCVCFGVNERGADGVLGFVEQEKGEEEEEEEYKMHGPV